MATSPAIDLALNWRHIGRLKSEFTSGNENLGDPSSVFAVDSQIDAYDYIDLDANVDIAGHLNVRFGVNNIADKKPPIVGFTANPLLVNGNLTAGMYDSLGRYLFIGLTAKY